MASGQWAANKEEKALGAERWESVGAQTSGRTSASVLHTVCKCIAHCLCSARSEHLCAQ